MIEKKKKALLVTLCAICFLQPAIAQRITRQYNNVSFSAALKDLNAAQDKYAINFVYDELEDFKVSKSIRNMSVPDAIQQLIGFYPIKMTQMDHVLIVECTQKAPNKMIGRIVDTHHRPIDFANVALLNVRDSSFITGGVTNENGQFVIPCEMRKAIIKVSCVGYHTAYHAYDTGKIGAITLKENTVHLDGIQVKAIRHNIKMGRGGMLVNIQDTELSKVGTATDVLREMPRVDVASDGTVSVFSKGQPLIYVNNRQVRDIEELKRLKSDDIKNVEIITSPGTQYDATVSSVIRIKTLGKQGEGWSGEGYATASYNKWWGTSQIWSSTYRTNHIEVFGNVWGNTRPNGDDNTFANELSGSRTIFVEQHSLYKSRSKGSGAKTGFVYSFDADNAVGLSYDWQYKGTVTGETTNQYQRISEEGQQVAYVDMTTDYNLLFSPVHDLNAYYLGKIGKLGVDLNTTYLWRKQGRDMVTYENSTDIESREAHTHSRQHSKMRAGKLVLTYPIWHGTLSLGSEITSSEIRGENANEEGYVEGSSTKILERNVAGFVDYTLPCGDFLFRAGARYEHVKTDYYSAGEWEKEPSRRYSDWFPSASLAWNKGKWSLSLAYSCKTRRPSYNSLRNEVQYNNRYSYEGGNPYLRPSIVNNFDLNIVYGWLSANAGYDYIDKPLVWNASLYQGKDIAFFRFMNFRNKKDVYASVVASPRFGWYNPMVEIDFTQSFLCLDGYDITAPSSRPSFRFKFNNRITITPSLKAFINMKYGTIDYDNLQYCKPYSQVDVRLSQSLCRQSLEIALFGNDLFRTSKEKWTLYGNHVIGTKDNYGYYREIGISLSYNFNATKSKYKGTGAGNAEKSRL